MAYFLPSFFQKRLLRYALSRLELVDTEALDLDSLGIRWGQRSSVELRDVGLKLEKITSLLHLPPSSELLSARVKYLRITVPADIYSSGIICEVQGVEVHLRLLSDETDNTDGYENDTRSRHHHHHHPAVHDPGGDQVLPTPADLAESFLEAEPEEEKEELQAVIFSQSQQFRRDSSSISDEEEEDQELGIGNEGLSLPSFVAGFLKGVADRLQVRVSDVSVRVDMELKQDGSAKRQPEDRPDLVTVAFRVGEVRVDAASTADDEAATPPVKAGRRLIALSNISAMLVSEPVVFSNYTRFTVPASPPLSVRPDEGDRHSSRTPSPVAPALSDSSSVLAMTRSTILERPSSPTNSVPQLLDESTYTADGRFSDAESELGHRGEESYNENSDLTESQYDDAILDNPAYLDSVIDSHVEQDDPEMSTTADLKEPLWSMTGRDDTPRFGTLPTSTSRSAYSPVDSYHQGRHSSMFRSFEGDPTDVEHASSAPPRSGAPSRSGSAPQAATYSQRFSENPEDLHPTLEDLLSHPDNPESPAATPGGELSESKLFSHEEAQSMYMSAISQTAASDSFTHNIPGAWDSPKSTKARAETPIRDKGPHLSMSVPPREPDELAHEEEDDESTAPTPKLAASPRQSVSECSTADLAHSRSSSERAQPISEPDAHAAGQPMEVAKKIFEVDRIFVWLPSVNKPDGDKVSDVFGSTRGTGGSQPENHLHQSNMYASSRLRAHSFGSDSTPEIKSSTAGFEKRSLPKKDSSELDVEVVCVLIRFDIATGWLLTKVGQKLLQALRSKGAAPPLKVDQPARNGDRSSLKLSLGDLTVKFLDHLPGYASTLESRPRSGPYHASEEVMLKLAISGLNLFLGTDGNGNNDLRLDVARFVFGFAAEDVLSFNEGLKMRESTRDIMSPAHGDVSLSIHKTKDAAKVSLTTLPVHLSLNIQRLEEAFTWIGGLSTILELGSSISSVSTVRHAKPEIVTKPRGVHFEATPPEPAKTQSLTWKVNSRIGGVVMDLIGETQSIRLKTTAVKIVSRFEGIGIQIDKAKLSGPLPLDETDGDPAKITMDNIRVEYLFTPKEVDMDRLLALITPSKDKYDEDDDIMLDTLLRQRRQGSVLRATVSGMKVLVPRIKDLDALAQLGNELSRLSTVAKYLPEDDRPGLLILSLIKDVECRLEFGGQIGYVNTQLRNVEAAHISIPSLVAAQVGKMDVTRNDTEQLVQEAHGSVETEDPTERSLPMLMARYIADEMDPTVKIKLHRLRVDYNPASVVAFLGLGDGATGSDLAANMASSLAGLPDLRRSFHSAPDDMSHLTSKSPKANSAAEPRRLAVEFRDCLLGLNPRDNPAQALIVLTNAKFAGAVSEDDSSEATLELRKATVMVIDDVRNVGSTENLRGRGSAVAHSGQVRTLIDLGYVPVSYLSSAMAAIKVMCLNEEGTKSIDVELRDDLLILETCADSTQTLIAVLNGLQPPTPPSKMLKYRTEVMPIQEMLASFTGDAYATEHGPDAGSVLVNHPGNAREELAGNDADEIEYVSDLYPPILAPDDDTLAASIGGPAHSLLNSFHSTYHVTSSVPELDFHEDHFAKQSPVEGTAHRWDSAHNTYGLSNDARIRNSPLRVRVRDVHVIWNLFDGYDWQRTRDAISKAVKNVEQKAIERRARARTTSRLSPGIDDEEESVIGDFLFNSIYIGIPANRDPRELNQDINRNIDDLASETGSYATSTTVTGATARQGRSPSVRGKRLRLHRSRHHKMTFELKGISADLVVFPPGSDETQSSLDVRVNDLEIFDHVPTSTWKKFATYMHEAGEKESGTSMVHLEILTVKPVPELAASEIILKATVLPLRLHVDQDALDFMSRFFEFRDESATAGGTPGDAPFLQRVEVNAVRVRLDFKPKRVDYAGLRSGRTTEFMNFFVLDGADMVLRHVIIYGVSGFDKLGQTLNDIWMPDVKRNQLPGVLAGLAPIRSLVNVGGGVKDLVVIPMREYKKDGRLVRSIQKGALAFAKTTTSELVKLGAKLAIGTQTVLQGAEDLLNPPGGTQVRASDEDSADEEETKRISLYADQPVGVVQGLRGAFSSLERDLLMTRDAIVAVPGEIVESGSAKAAAKAVLKRAPTVILRPAIGVSKAVGQTLLGAGNTLDPSNRRKMEDKYKRH